MSERFWIVTDVDHERQAGPFDSEIRAKEEAESWAKQNPGQGFFVLCAICRSLVPELGEITKELQ